MSIVTEARSFNFLTRGILVPILELPYICLKARMYRLYYKAKLSGNPNTAAPRMLHPSVLSERWWINFFYRDYNFDHYSRGVKEYRHHQELRHFFNEPNPFSKAVLSNLNIDEAFIALSDEKGFILEATNFIVEEGFVSLKVKKGKGFVDWPIKFWNTKELEINLKALHELDRRDGWADVNRHLINGQTSLPKDSGEKLLVHLSPYFIIKAIHRVPKNYVLFEENLGHVDLT